MSNTPNTSATGGYLKPASTVTLPQNLSVVQFIQSVLVGVSQIDGELVRPQWQGNPPGQPDAKRDWLSFAIKNPKSNTMAVITEDAEGNNNFLNYQDFEVSCILYGPNAFDNMDLIIDSLEIPQNREALSSVNMKYVEASSAIHAPELINETWFERYDFTLYMRRAKQRVYPVLTILSASGVLVNDVGGRDNTIAFNSGG